jgi:hypothetical protein
MEHNVDFRLNSTQQDNLLLLTTGGALPPDPTNLLRSERMHLLMGLLQANADVILFDSPPALSVADALLLSSRVDCVVLVFAAGQTQRSLARDTARSLNQVGARLMGVVLNRATHDSAGYAGDGFERPLHWQQRLAYRFRLARQPKPGIPSTLLTPPSADISNGRITAGSPLSRRPDEGPEPEPGTEGRPNGGK